MLDVKNMAHPLDTHGAVIDNLVFRKSDSVLGRTAGFVTIGFSYRGLEVGDVLSLRFYGYNDTFYDPTASLTVTVSAGSSLVGDGTEQPDSDYRLKLSYKYETTMEVYLNGVLAGRARLHTLSGDFAAARYSPTCRRPCGSPTPTMSRRRS